MLLFAWRLLVAILSLSSRFLLSLSCRSFLLPPCRPPVACLSSSRRLPVASLWPRCRLPFAQCGNLSLSCRLPVACPSLACRLPVASLLPPCRLPVAFPSPPCHPMCYPVAPLLHCCGLPIAFLWAACRLPVASLLLSCRLPVAFLALFDARKKETLSPLRSFPFALCFTILWLSSISIIVVSLSDLPFIRANGMIWL